MDYTLLIENLILYLLHTVVHLQMLLILLLIIVVIVGEGGVSLLVYGGSIASVLSFFSLQYQ